MMIGMFINLLFMKGITFNLNFYFYNYRFIINISMNGKNGANIECLESNTIKKATAEVCCNFIRNITITT